MNSINVAELQTYEMGTTLLPFNVGLYALYGDWALKYETFTESIFRKWKVTK
jgi:hypothetical protein